MTAPRVSLDWRLVTVLAIASLLRLACIGLRNEELSRDRDAYLAIAQSIADGRGFCGPQSTVPTAYRPPLYPCLIGVLQRPLGQPVAVAIVNLCAGVATVGLTWTLARRLGLSEWTATFASGFVAINPLLLVYTPQPMTESLFSCLTTGLLAALTRFGGAASAVQASPVHQRWNAIESGIWFGLAVLCRPTLWPFLGVFGLLDGYRWLWPIAPNVDPRVERQVVLRRWGFWLMVIALTVAPWVLRNYRAFGVPVLTTTHGGYTLWLANNETFDRDVVAAGRGTDWPNESLVGWQNDIAARMEAALGPTANEVTRDRWQAAQAWQYIRLHPDRTLAAMGVRIAALWSPVPGGEGGRGLPRVISVTLIGFYGLLYVAALCGLRRVITERAWARWWPLFALVLSVQGVHLLYWTNTRMRTPFEPVLALLAAHGVTAIWRWRTDCRR